MRFTKVLVFGSALAAVVAAAVISVGAQESRRGRAIILDGRGSQLGVMIRDLEGDAVAKSTGVEIEEVTPDSPAAKAGLKAGDIVTEYDGERVRSARQFTRLVQETPEGRSVSMAERPEADPSSDAGSARVVVDDEDRRRSHPARDRARHARRSARVPDGFSSL